MAAISDESKKWIAFDAAGTLFETAEPVEDIYADCFSTLGFGIPEATWNAAFKRAYQLTPDPLYPESGDWEAVEKDWWRDLVRRAAEATGIRPDPDTMADAFEELFDHYAAGSAWKLFPETETVLSDLKAQGIGLAVISNFDSRLHRVLEELGIRKHFDFVLTSADVGARKPDPAILSKFLETAGTGAERACMVGDSVHTDGGAAEASGIEFYHVQRPTSSLSDLAEWHRGRF